MDDIVIVSAARTPVGSFNGALGTLSAHELGAIALARRPWPPPGWSRPTWTR